MTLTILMTLMKRTTKRRKAGEASAVGVRPADRVAFVFHGMLKSPTQAPAAEGEESGPLVEIEEVSILFCAGGRLAAWCRSLAQVAGSYGYVQVTASQSRPRWFGFGLLPPAKKTQKTGHIP